MVIPLKKEVRAKLRLIYTILLILEKFPHSKIRALLTGHLLALMKEPIAPEMQMLIDLSEPIFSVALAAMSVKSIDISGRSSDVLKYAILKKLLPSRINIIKIKIQNLMPGDEAILTLLNLVKVSFYTKSTQSDIIENLTNLETKIIETSELATVIPLATALKMDYINTLKAKSNKIFDVTKDSTDITPLILDVKSMLIRNFGYLNFLLYKNLEAIPNYFPIVDMSNNQAVSEKLKINKYKIAGFQGAALHLIDVNFKFGDYLQADCRKCLNDVYIFLASEITNVVPLNAQKIKKGERIIFKINTVGSSTQQYLMVVFAKDESLTEECNFFITIDKTKPQRKNILKPNIATPPETIVITPEPTVVIPKQIDETPKED